MSRLPAFRRFPEEDPLTVACGVHQAGHLVVATVAGFRIVSADILGCAGLCEWHLPIVAPDTMNWLEQCRLPEKMVAVRLAGPVALRLVGWDAHGDAACAEDMVGARNLLRPILDSEAEIETAVRRIEAQVTSALLHRLEQVYQLTAAFLRFSILTPDDIAREIALAAL